MRKIEGTEVVDIEAGHGHNILDLTNMPKSVLGKSGIGYFVPIFKTGQWIVLFKSFEEGGENLNHLDWWDEYVLNLFVMKNHLDEDDKMDIEMSYTGIPRFRVEYVDFKFVIYWGKNVCGKLLTMAVRTIGLNKGEYVWKYDAHEVIDKRDQKQIEMVTGGKFSKPIC